MLLDPVNQLAAIATIGPDTFQSLPEGWRKVVEQELGSIAVLNCSLMHHDMQQIAHRID